MSVDSAGPSSDSFAGKSEQELREQFQAELQNNPRYKEFFAQYSPSSVDSFISSYAKKKAWFVINGESISKQSGKSNYTIMDSADEIYWMIRQAHLFELQCLWRAEQMTLPFIECTADFFLAGLHIRSLDFLPPVSQFDIDLMCEFLESGELDLSEHLLYLWQDYDEIKELADESDWGNPWYAFYFERLAKSYILELGDIRGGKEQYYYSLAREKSGENQPVLFPPDERPYLDPFDPETIKKFIRKFETPQMLQYYLLCDPTHMDEEKEKVKHAFNFLLSSDELMAIESNSDWREAILIAADKCQGRQLAEALQQYYNDLLYREENGILSNDDDNLDQFVNALTDMPYKKMLRHGRELNGEPPDLNF